MLLEIISIIIFSIITLIILVIVSIIIVAIIRVIKETGTSSSLNAKIKIGENISAVKITGKNKEVIK